MVGEHIGKEQLELIAGRTIKDADQDIDELINFEEFKKVFILLKYSISNDNCTTLEFGYSTTCQRIIVYHNRCQPSRFLGLPSLLL